MTHPLDPAAVGRRSHAFIAHLEQNGSRHASNKDIDQLAGAFVKDEPALVHRLALRTRIASDAMIYRDHLAPPDNWQIVGVEVKVGDARLDLLWRTSRDGCLIGGELKSNSVPSPAALNAQLARQLNAAHARWGDNFVGVRLCLIRRPAVRLATLAADASVAYVDDPARVLPGRPHLRIVGPGTAPTSDAGRG